MQDTFTNVSGYKILEAFEYSYNSLKDRIYLDLRTLPNQGYRIGESTSEQILG